MTRRWVRSGALGLVVLLGVALRLGLLLHWPRRLNVDEATVGLMGLHILRGEFPVFMYSVAYQGTPESYLTAVVYALAGASPLTLKLTVFLFSCLLIAVSFLIGRRMAGWPGGLCSAVLVAVAPPFLPVYGNYPMLGYMEVVVVGSLVLLLTLDLVTDERGGARLARKLLVLGLVAGLGWWINPMIVSYLAAAGIFLVLSPGLWSSRALWAVPLGFLLGSLPYWIFNLTHSFWSFVLFRKGTRGSFTAGLKKASELLLEIVGVRGVLTDPVPFLSAAAGVVYLCLLGILVAELARSFVSGPAEARVQRRGSQLLMLFSLMHLAAFSISGYTEFAVQRYLFPLYSSIPILSAMALLGVWRWSRLLAVGALSLLLLNNTLALWKTVQVYETGRQADWWKPEPVVEFLQSEGLTRAFALQRIAFRLTFETGERIVAIDPFLSDRYPTHLLQSVYASPRVAYVLADRAELAPGQFEPTLRGIGASYRRKDFGVFSVFYDFQPPFRGALASIPPNGWRAESEPRGSDPARAFDRDVDTAWLSGEYLRPEMWYRVDLGKALPVAGVTVLPIQPRTGAPKGYRVEVSRDGRAWDVVAAVSEFEVTLTWRDGQPRMDRSGQIVSGFAPRSVRYVRITQTGESAESWWAIAEIFVYGPAEGPEPPHRREAVARLDEGARLEKAGRLESALAVYERAARLDPESEEAHWRMAEVFKKARLPLWGTEPDRRAPVFERLGLWARAAREYEKLLGPPAEDGGYSDLLNRLLAIYRRLGDRDAAERVERRLREEYSPPTRAEASFGQSARLLGYGLAPPEPRAGEIVEFTYYWQALRPMTEDLTVFVHFVRDGSVRFTQDHEPLHGRHPTSRWREGELLWERYRVRLPEELSPGEYEIRVGLWNPRTGKRVRVGETALPRFGDHVRLATVRLLPPR